MDFYVLCEDSKVGGEELPTWEQSSITSSTTDVLDFIHTRPAAQRHTAQSGASLSVWHTHASLRDTKISSKKTLYCQWFLLSHTVIVVKFIKSMPQRRQEQTAERKKGARRGEREREGGAGRDQHWDSGSRKQDARKQVGRGMKASHRVQSIIPVVLMLKLNIIWLQIAS